MKKKKLIHKSLIKPKRETLKVVNFKVTPKEKKEILEIANKYCKGNVTALVKLSIKAFRPSKKDLVKVL
jgi:hypothetical protein